MDGQGLLVLVKIRLSRGVDLCALCDFRKDRKNDPFVKCDLGGFKIQKCCDDGVRGCCCCYDNSNPAVNTGIVSKNACVSGFSF